jgi:hypothetical protein
LRLTAPEASRDGAHQLAVTLSRPILLTDIEAATGGLGKFISPNDAGVAIQMEHGLVDYDFCSETLERSFSPNSSVTWLF